MDDVQKVGVGVAGYSGNGDALTILKVRFNYNHSTYHD